MCPRARMFQNSRTQEFQSGVPELDWGGGHDRGGPSWLPLGSQDKGTFKGWSLDGSVSCPRQLQSAQEDLQGEGFSQHCHMELERWWSSPITQKGSHLS